jgi:hypothetical protein
MGTSRIEEMAGVAPRATGSRVRLRCTSVGCGRPGARSTTEEEMMWATAKNRVQWRGEFGS